MRDALQRTLGTGIRLERELGGGGMSSVYLATDLSLDRQIVVKVLPAEFSAGVRADRFRQEIQLVAKLQHPHIVPILAAGDAEGSLYYVMPFLAGESLRARMAREGPLPLADATRIVRETLDALAFAHAHGVIHRDIKPENILLAGGHAVIADFGISKALRASGSVTTTGVVLGTPRYMAPEQAIADASADHRADLYAVAVVAYEVLTGEPPFSGNASQLLKSHVTDRPAPIKQRRSDVPDGLADILMRALEKDPARRPQSAREMMEVLDAVTTPVGPRDPSRGGTGKPTIGASLLRRSGMAWLGSAAVAVVAVGATWYVLRPNVITSAQSIAIAPFSVADGDTALVRLGQNLVTTMSANLDGVGEIRVADPMAVLSHAKSKGALLSGLDALDIARKLGARSVVHGTLVGAGSSVRADLALYDVESPGTPVARVSATVPTESISALTDSLTWGLLREVWAHGRAPTPNASSIATHSPLALREFLEGERLFARGGPLLAAEAYRRAIAADTTFWFAHYRYRIAREWFLSPVDTTIRNRLSRHIAALPERERLLLMALDSTRTISERQQKLTELQIRHPDYAPAILAYGDYALHHAIRAGWDVRDAIAPFRRLTQLMPSDMLAVQHLGATCVAIGDRACVQQALLRLDSMVNADPAPLPEPKAWANELRYLIHQVSLTSADSVAHAALRDTIPPGMGNLPFTGALLLEQPDGLKEQDRVYERLVGRPGMQLVRSFRSYTAIGRGDPTAVDSFRVLAPEMPPQIRAQLQPERFIDRVRILLELQELTAPSVTTAEEALALAARPGATAGERIESRWIAGASALWRGDSTMLRAQLSELARDTSARARTALRSLRALALGRGGNRNAAAESLLVIEREHGERRTPMVVWAAYAADRILGAGWLSEAHRYAPADSLLRYTRGLPASFESGDVSQATYGTAQLLRSRIAEGMGRNEDAIAFARIFLAAFDRAPPGARGLRDEAYERIRRLGGKLDDRLPAQPVPASPRG
jgi:TolB-like protein